MKKFIQSAAIAASIFGLVNPAANAAAQPQEQDVVISTHGQKAGHAQGLGWACRWEVVPANAVTFYCTLDPEMEMAGWGDDYAGNSFFTGWGGVQSFTHPYQTWFGSRWANINNNTVGFHVRTVETNN